MFSKKLLHGVVMWVLFLAGLLILWLLFLRGKSSSAKQTIKNVLLSNGYTDRFVDWWVAVSNFETAAWSSPLFKTANNLFGMKQPLKRMSLSKGPTTSGFATFDSWSDSVKDLMLYFDEFGYPKDFSNVENLVAFMKDKGYFQEPYEEYLAGVKSRL